MNPDNTFSHAVPSMLATPAESLLLLIDWQERLVPAMARREQVVAAACRLIEGACLLDVPRVATEQYPKGLGTTIPEIRERWDCASSITPCIEKLTFSCLGAAEVVERLQDAAITTVAVSGIETHVCVQQTVLDLLAFGKRVIVATDAVGSRFESDHHTALRRMESSGAILTTTESLLFEWCRTASHTAFKSISTISKGRTE